MSDINFLNATVWAKVGVSKIHGVGVIAIRDIPKGTAITDYNIYHHAVKRNMFEMSEEDFMKLDPAVRGLILDKILLPKGQKTITFFSPNHEVCLQGFMNDSQDPNTDGHKTLRDIKAGEELTENYSALYTEGLHHLNVEHFFKGYEKN